MVQTLFLRLLNISNPFIYLGKHLLYGFNGCSLSYIVLCSHIFSTQFVDLETPGLRIEYNLTEWDRMVKKQGAINVCILTFCKSFSFCSNFPMTWVSCSWVWSRSFSIVWIFFWRERASSSACWEIVHYFYEKQVCWLSVISLLVH